MDYKKLSKKLSKITDDNGIAQFCELVAAKVSDDNLQWKVAVSNNFEGDSRAVTKQLALNNRFALVVEEGGMKWVLICYGYEDISMFEKYGNIEEIQPFRVLACPGLDPSKLCVLMKDGDTVKYGQSVSMYHAVNGYGLVTFRNLNIKTGSISDKQARFVATQLGKLTNSYVTFEVNGDSLVLKIRKTIVPNSPHKGDLIPNTRFKVVSVSVSEDRGYTEFVCSK